MYIIDYIYILYIHDYTICVFELINLLSIYCISLKIQKQQSESLFALRNGWAHGMWHRQYHVTTDTRVPKPIPWYPRVSKAMVTWGSPRP